jgi:hypothetical protein
MFGRYENIAVTKDSTMGNRFYVNNIYPDIPYSENDIYLISTMGDRLDLYALDFYNDDKLWVFIASANSLPGDSIYPPIGMQIRIPANLQGIINNYKSVNVNR